MEAPSFAGLETIWHGSELFELPGWSVDLSPAELEELERGAVGLRSDVRTNDAGATIPLSKLTPTLDHVRARLELGGGVMRMRGMPVTQWGDELTTRAFWLLASRLGTPLSQSPAGERLFHVRDRGYAPEDPRFRGPASRKRLSFHTDRCDVIAFACLRQAAHGGDNFIVSSVALYEELRTRNCAVLATLRKPFPYLRHTVDTANERRFCRLPVFSDYDGHFAGHFLRVLIDRADRDPATPDLTEAQRHALDVLESLAEDPRFNVRLRLEPGDLLLLNNWTTFHRRDAFADTADPSAGRHLLRIWLSVPNSRPIDPCFGDHFGATAAGAVRGGMRPAHGRS